MRRMGFSFHPGPLPFVTIRRQQWANRLTLGENIECHGEHGCAMPPICAVVIAIEPFDAAKHADLHIPPVYAGQGHLQAISLREPFDGPWVKVGESWVLAESAK